MMMALFTLFKLMVQLSMDIILKHDIATGDTTYYALGIHHVFSGSAQTTFETLVEILDDSDVIRKELGKSNVSSVIITKVNKNILQKCYVLRLFCTVLVR